LQRFSRVGTGGEPSTKPRPTSGDHLFLNGTGPPTQLEYTKPGHVDPKLIATIAAWIDKVKAAPAHP
jgi:hypothetical protein